ncbi:MAG: hypothetical protein DMF16_11125 [Verrucomicrobia bacterium]|nr:MAG: hypothetical protein DMF16_11125 [Verrucomicrobiota bacterium]
MRFVIPTLLYPILVSASASGTNEAPYNSATISGLGARNIGSAAMSGRISAVEGVKEPSGKITLFVGAASGGIWKSDDGGTRFRPVFDEQAVQSIGAIAIDPKNSKNIWVGSGESWTRNSVSIGDGIYKSSDGGETWTNAGLATLFLPVCPAPSGATRRIAGSIAQRMAAKTGSLCSKAVIFRPDVPSSRSTLTIQM